MVIPIVIGALGTISKNSSINRLVKTSDNLNFGTLQKACLLGTVRILRYALNTDLRLGVASDTQLNITSFLKSVHL